MKFEHKMHIRIFGKTKKQFDLSKNPDDSKHFGETNKKVIGKLKDYAKVNGSATSLF